MADVFISYAQNFEDVILYRALKGIKQGFYIDVGAWDPVIDSVTKAFYDRGWHGINIEPSRTYFEKLEAERPRDINLMVVAGSRAGLTVFYEILETGLSTAKKEIADHFARAGYKVREYQVPCLPLATICEANRIQEIHFLKIDVEGMETEVIQGCDFARFRPWIVIIEAIDPIQRKPVRPEWELLLFEHGYEFVYFDGLNRFYLACERLELKEAFAVPPGVLDGFVRYSEWQAKQESEHSKEAMSAVEAEKRALGEQIATLQANQEVLRRQLEEQKEQLQTVQSLLIGIQTELLEREQRLMDLQAQLAQAAAEKLALQRVLEQQEGRLAELSKTLSVAQAQKEELQRALAASLVREEEFRQMVRGLQAEREALQRQAEELTKWLQAVYSSTSWRVTAPLRFAKKALVRTMGVARRAVVGTVRLLPRLGLKILAKIARWAAKDPRLRSLVKKLLSRSPALRARVRRLIAPQAPGGTAVVPASESLAKVEEGKLPESARAVLAELKAALKSSGCLSRES